MSTMAIIVVVVVVVISCALPRLAVAGGRQHNNCNSCDADVALATADEQIDKSRLPQDTERLVAVAAPTSQRMI